jgi:hypothetical protein
LNPLGLLPTLLDDVNCGRYLPALLAAAGEVLLLFVLLPELPPALLPELPPALLFAAPDPSPEALPELAEADAPELSLPFPFPWSLLAETVSELPSEFADPEEAGVVFLRA